MLGTAIIALGAAALWFVIGDERATDRATEPVVETPAGEARDPDPADVDSGVETATSDDPPIGQIAVDAIDDAESVVDQINDRDEELELLAELGLDETGQPIAAASEPAGHRFTWTLLDGTVATVTVDLTTGDHTYDDDQGISYRLVGSEAFGRIAPDAEWTSFDPGQLPEIDRPGLDGPLRIDDVLGPADAFAAIDETSSDLESIVWTIDDAAFAAAAPQARTQWLDVIGLSDDEPIGAVVIRLVVADGSELLRSAQIERPATGESVSYRLDELYENAPTIEAPER